jgi:hypothetical protein
MRTSPVLFACLHTIVQRHSFFRFCFIVFFFLLAIFSLLTVELADARICTRLLLASVAYPSSFFTPSFGMKKSRTPAMNILRGKMTVEKRAIHASHKKTKEKERCAKQVKATRSGEKGSLVKNKNKTKEKESHTKKEVFS